MILDSLSQINDYCCTLASVVYAVNCSRAEPNSPIKGWVTQEQVIKDFGEEFDRWTDNKDPAPGFMEVWEIFKLLALLKCSAGDFIATKSIVEANKYWKSRPCFAGFYWTRYNSLPQVGKRREASHCHVLVKLDEQWITVMDPWRPSAQMKKISIPDHNFMDGTILICSVHPTAKH